MEKWKELDYRGAKLVISTNGRVFRRVLVDDKWVDNQMYTPQQNSDGYLHISLSLGGRSGITIFPMIHRLVCLAWVDNPRNVQFVDHIDKNKQNNYYDNLRWVTKAENNARIKYNRPKMYSSKEYKEIMARYSVGESINSIARRFNTGRWRIRSVIYSDAYRKKYLNTQLVIF